MDPQLPSIIGIVLGPATLIVLAFSRVDLLTGLTDTCMKGFSAFAMKFFLILPPGTIFGKVMDDTSSGRCRAASRGRPPAAWTCCPTTTLSSPRRRAYKPVCLQAVATPILTNVLAIVVAMALH